MFKLEASPVEGQSLLQKIKKGEKGKAKEKKIKKLKILRCKSRSALKIFISVDTQTKNVLKRGASGKKGML